MMEWLIKLGSHAETVMLAVLILVAVVLLLYLAGRWNVRRQKLKQQGRGEAIYQSIIAASARNAHMVVRGRDRQPVFVTDSIEALLGISPKLLQANLKNIKKVMGEESRAIWNRFEEWDGESPLEESFCTGDGRWIKLTVTESGRYDLWEFTDITEFYEERNDLIEKLAAAESESESKLQFLSRMSHEIRTPMNGIIGMLALMGEQPLTDQARNYLEKVKGQSAYLLSLLNDILDMSRIDNGKLELEHKDFDLFDVAEEVRGIFQKNIEARGVRFTLELLAFEKHVVNGDRLRLTQVIANLLSNAQKFTAKGEVRLTFHALMQSETHLNFMIQVHDTGIGMDPKFVDRIFNPFEQETTETTRRYGGTGLGMAITNRIVKLMGGEIVVNTMLGAGTDFSVYLELPLAGSQVTAKTAPAIGAETVEAEYTLQGRRALMAEDNELNRLVAEELLQEQGVELITVENGKEAVEAFESHEAGYFDFILMDIRMPVMDGLEATKAIRALDRADAKKVPIFALSADAFVEDQRRSVDAGMNGHFSKPVNYKEMRKQLALYMHSQGSDATGQAVDSEKTAEKLGGVAAPAPNHNDHGYPVIWPGINTRGIKRW